MHISEPKLVNDVFTSTGGPTYIHSRYGPLGTGATVVRTPQDALARAMLNQAQPYPSHDPPGATDDDDVSSYEGEDEPEPASPGSPPLPPLPFASKSSPNLPVLSEMGELIHMHGHGRVTRSPTRTKPTRPCPAPPASAARPPLIKLPASLSAVPTRPLHVTPAPPQPPFTPILLSPIPDVLFDLSSLIVTLDTSTCSLRTTFTTLTSRPSHLAHYLQVLARSAHEREQKKFRDTLVEEDEDFADEDGHDLSSPSTPFASLFAAHLTSAGLLPQSGGMIHLFLDRPSAPYVFTFRSPAVYSLYPSFRYVHILTYLRSPPSHAALPRTASLGGRSSQSPERLETLLELRDEAKYLGLDELYKLCCDELRQSQGHVRGGSGSSTGSGNQQVLIAPERGRDTTLVRLGAIVRREVQQGYPREETMMDGDRDSMGSSGPVSVRSEVAHVEGVPVSPASASASSPSASSLHHPRTMTPIVEGSVSRAQSRSRSQGPLNSAWI